MATRHIARADCVTSNALVERDPRITPRDAAATRSSLLRKAVIAGMTATTIAATKPRSAVAVAAVARNPLSATPLPAIAGTWPSHASRPRATMRAAATEIATRGNASASTADHHPAPRSPEAQPYRQLRRAR